MIKYYLTLILVGITYGQGADKALDFDGSNDYVNMGNVLNLTSSISIETWIKTDGLGSRQTILGKGYTSSGEPYYQYHVEVRSGGEVYFPLSLGGTRQSAETSATLASQWHHIACVYNGSVIKVYIDGEEEASSNASGSISTYSSSFYIGAYSGASGGIGPFEGQIDEVRIWSDARTVTEIRDNMHKELAGDESGLVAYYKMSDGTGTSLTDNSSNSNTGTLTNMNASDDWVTSQAPIGDLGSSYKTDTEGIWKTTGTNASDASDGFAVTVSSALSTGNFAVFGNNNTSGISSSDLGSVGSTRRTGRIWQVDESGTVAGTVTIDISDASGITSSPGTASNFRLLYRSNTSGDFSSVATGASLSGDVVSFTSISLADGYYALGGQGDASLPVDLSSFNLVSSRFNAMTLEWVTESEIDNLGFIVDRRTISSDWAEIASYITHPELQGQGSVSYQTTYSFTDATVLEGEIYDYRLADVDYNGTKEYHTLQLMGVSPSEPIPGNYRLHQNYPNPFNPVTTFRYDLPIDNTVRITITDIRGNEVKLYMKNHTVGSHQVQWDGKNGQGHPVSAGVYLYTIQAGDFINTKKMILLK